MCAGHTWTWIHIQMNGRCVIVHNNKDKTTCIFAALIGLRIFSTHRSPVERIRPLKTSLYLPLPIYGTVGAGSPRAQAQARPVCRELIW